MVGDEQMAKTGIVSIPLRDDPIHMKLRAFVMARPNATDKNLFDYAVFSLHVSMNDAHSVVRAFRNRVPS